MGCGHLLHVVSLLDLDGKLELSTFTEDWFDSYPSSKCFDDLLGYVQPQTNTFLVEIVSIINVPETFEQLAHLLLLDSNTRILNLNLQVQILIAIIKILVFDFEERSGNLNADSDASLWCELQSIWLKVQDNLL